jgi:anti-sigma factor RsiW
MNCKHIQDVILTGYIDGELSAEEKSVMDSHISSCTACRQFLTSVQLTNGVLHQTTPSFPQDKIWLNIKEQIKETETAQPNLFINFFGTLKQFLTVPKVAVMTIVLILVVYYFAPHTQVQTASVPAQSDVQYLVYFDDESSNEASDGSYNTEIENYFL